MATTTKARKGDLILVELVTHNSWSMDAIREAKALGRELPDVTTTYEFGVVGSTTREGEVKTWHPVGFGDALICTGPSRAIGTNRRRWVMPAKQVDVTGVLTAAKAHHWPGHPGQPKPFATYAEARQAAQPYLTVPVRNPEAVRS